MIRHDFDWPLDPRFLLLPLLITLVARSMALMYYGAYQGVFAYFGLWDLAAIFKAVTLSAVLSGGLTFFVGLQSFPRSVFIIDWAIILFMLAGVRYGLRAWVRQRWRQRGQRRHKALVVGAGVGGRADRPHPPGGSAVPLPAGRLHRRGPGALGVPDPRRPGPGRRHGIAAGGVGQPDPGGFCVHVGPK